MNELHINRVVIWLPLGADGLLTRESPPGRPYHEDGEVKVAMQNIYRYAKNYKVKKGDGEIGFCLFVLTFSKAADKVEKYLDKVAKGLDAKYVSDVLNKATVSGFEYTNNYYGGDK